MKTNYYLWIIIFMMATIILSEKTQAKAQQNKIDSLLFLVKTDKPVCATPCLADSVKINHINLLAWELKYIDPDTAIVLTSQALKLSEKINWQQGIGQSEHQLGAFNWLKGDFVQSLDLYFKALDVWNQILLTNKNQTVIYSKKAATLGNIGNVYTEQGDFPKALDYYLKALKIDEQLGNEIAIARWFGNIGTLYRNEKNIVKALDYFFKALKIDEALGNNNGVSKHLGNIGSIYMEQGDYSKALDYYFKALKIDEEVGNMNGMSVKLGKIGSVYGKQKEYGKALDFLLQSLTIAEELGDKYSIAICNGNLGTLKSATKNYTEAEKYLLKALSTAESINALQLVKEYNSNLSELYTLMGYDRKALLHYEKAMLAKDSLFNEEKDKEITSKALMYEFDKKEAATKAEQDKKDLLSVAEIKRQTLIKNGTLAGVGIAGFFSFLLVRSVNRRKKIAFDKTVSVVEMKALRSQMNPHFISNSMQSINKYIMDNEKESASEYLSRFTNLMRMILENSRQQEITVEQDMHALELYLQLEALRYNNRFEYKIEISNEINPENTLIPPLMLQPFVENSILHGIRTKEKGMIQIKVNREGDIIRCTVEDNGIGRTQSVVIESGEEQKRESLGMKITNERLAIINQLKKAKASINVFDLKSNDDMPLGVRVELVLPYEQAF